MLSEGQAPRSPVSPLHLDENSELFDDDCTKTKTKSTTMVPSSSSSSHLLDVIIGSVHSRKPPRGQWSPRAIRVPKLDEIIQFYTNVYEHSQMEHDTIIISLIYIERLMNGSVVRPTPWNWKSILIASMVLASKVWDDLSMWNVDFSRVCEDFVESSLFTLRRINQLELAMLRCLRYDVKVNASEYAKYYFRLRCFLVEDGGKAQKDDLTCQTQNMERVEVPDIRNQQQETGAKHHLRRHPSHRRVKSLGDNEYADIFPTPKGDETACACGTHQRKKVIDRACNTCLLEKEQYRRYLCLEQIVSM